MKKGTIFSIFLVSVSLMVAAASLYLWQSQRKNSRDLLSSVYSDAFLGFLHAAEAACDEIGSFDPLSPSTESLSSITREAELSCFYFSRLPVPYGMLSDMSRFLKSAPEYFGAAARLQTLPETVQENIARLKALAERLGQALAYAEGRFLSARDPYGAVCDFFDRENYVRAGQGDGDFSAFFLDDILYDMPELSYEGELSRHRSGMGFALLGDAAVMNEKKAKAAAREYLKENIDRYRYAGTTEDFPPCHIFSFGDAYMTVTKQGGYVMTFSLAFRGGEDRLTAGSLAMAAEEAAEDLGFGVCRAVYLYKSAGVVYFSCTPKEAETKENVILGLDYTYGKLRYLNAYDYYKYHGIDGTPA